MDMYVVCDRPPPCSLITTLQTKCKLLLVNNPLAGWRCASQLLLDRHQTHTHICSSGFGTSMTNSQMVIMWPNKDGSVTVSQRTASSHTEPQVDPTPQRIAQTDLAVSAVSDYISNMSNNKRLCFVLRSTATASPIEIRAVPPSPSLDSSGSEQQRN